MAAPAIFNKVLSGKVAIVTGSTTGIGVGIAKRLAEAGADVVLNAREKEPQNLNALLKEVKAYGTRVEYCPADMSKREELVSLARTVEKDMGKVDILVNNAGIQHVCEFVKFPREMWDAILSINLTAPFVLMQEVIPGMQKRGFGRVINVASVQGLVSSKHKCAYNSAKHGLIGLTKSVALDLARENVTVNAICPGYVWTPLVQKSVTEDANANFNGNIEKALEAMLEDKMPSLKMVRPEALGDAAVFLASPAAEEMRGTTITIDGGWVAR